MILLLVWMIRIFIKALFKLFVYFPLVMLSIVSADQFMTRQESWFLWSALSLLLASGWYYAVYFFKGMLIGFKENSYWLWKVIFLLCIYVTCLLPMLISFECISMATLQLTGNPNRYVIGIFTTAFTFYVYSRYKFMTNCSPADAFVFYNAGCRFAFFLLGKIRQLN